tara:strand:- start:1050 stop:1217 length:168 start_codon:yes stop_codon:yes gene_type:complete
MDEKKYLEFSKNLIEHYVKINDWKSAFKLIIKVLSKLEKNKESLEELTKTFEGIN